MGNSIPRIAELPPAWDRTAAASARAVLVTERETLRRSQEAVDAATDVVVRSLEGVREDDVEILKRRALWAMGAAAPLLRERLRNAVASGSQDARSAARDRLGAELELAAVALGVGTFDAPPPDDAAEDIGHADAAADAYAAAWRTAVLAIVARSASTPDTPVAQDVRKVVSLHEYRLRRIAATDNARAYNDEHAHGTRWIGEHYAPTGQRLQVPIRTAASEAARLGVTEAEYQARYAFGGTLAKDERYRRALRRGPEGISFIPDAEVEDAIDDRLPAWARPLVGRLMRRWEARNDSKTCPFCRSMNGALTLLGKPFPNGYEPGGPHPNCRCNPTIIVLTPEIIIANEKRAPAKGTAVLQFEKQLPRDAVAQARARELIKVRR